MALAVVRLMVRGRYDSRAMRIRIPEHKPIYWIAIPLGILILHSLYVGAAYWDYRSRAGLLEFTILFVDPVALAIIIPQDPDGPTVFRLLLFWGSVQWGVMALVFCGVNWARWSHRTRKERIRQGACPACGYPRGTSAVCTECGKELPVIDSDEHVGSRE